MSARRPLCRVRYDAILAMWVVSATEHTTPGFRSLTAWTSWHEAMRSAHQLAELLLEVQRELDKLNSRRPNQRLKPARHWQGGPLGEPDGRWDMGGRYGQGGLIAGPSDGWNLRDGGRRYDVLADGLANLTYEVTPGLVRLEPALPWADNHNTKEDNQ